MRVEFPSGGDRIGGALYAPESSGPHPGVVIVPDVWGLYDHYHDVARRVAANGFVALALDLYSREGAPDLPDMDAVFRFMKELPDRRVLQDIQAAIDALAAREEVGERPIGITGFCMGGKYVILAACTCRGLSAAVPWYGLLRVPGIDGEFDDALDLFVSASVAELATVCDRSSQRDLEPGYWHLVSLLVEVSDVDSRRDPPPTSSLPGRRLFISHF